MSRPDPKIRPIRWTPPPNPEPVRRRGDARTLPDVRVIALPGRGPEHVAVDAEGDVLAGLADGGIVRIPESGGPEILANTGGRPLGVEFRDSGTLIVCDAFRGLLSLSLADGTIDVLCDSVDGEELTFCSNAAISADGTIYFTQSSRRFNVDRYRGDLLEHSTTGRLLRYRDGNVAVVADGFAFANGVVLSDDESFAVVAETGGYRLTRVELATGAKSTFVSGLPGFPDNLTRDDQGLIWIAMVSPRDPLLDWLLPRSPRWRAAVWATPERLQPGPQDVAWARAVDWSGATVHDLRGWQAGYKMVTAVRRHGTRLYPGSLIEPGIAVVELPAESASGS
jgi:hypothetical protein